MPLSISDTNLVQSGELLLFSHYENDGEMWARDGDRQIRKYVEFDQHFESAPIVMLTIKLLDVDTQHFIRYDLFADKIDEIGFDILFKTWADTRFARVAVQWVAIGKESDPALWTNI